MKVSVYTFLNSSDNEDSFHTQDPAEAKAYAERYNLLVVDNTFAFEDSQGVSEWDFRIKSEDVEACPGCGCKPGDGATEGCDDPDGCGYSIEQEDTE